MDMDPYAALFIAKRVHRDQKRRGGAPYIFHPVRVAENVRALGGTDVQVAAALLHDAIEDSPTSNLAALVEEIRRDCGQEVLDLVMVLTHREKETYRQYLAAVHMAGQDAVLIKVCDIFDNLMDDPMNPLKYLAGLAQLTGCKTTWED